MSSSYPGTLDTFPTTKVDGTDAGDDTPGSQQVGDHALHHNNLADAVNKIEAELGTNPSGAFATVKARLDAAATGRPFVDVKADYGAAGDGTSDDSAEIQAAINSLGTVGGTVFFPPGVYKCNTGLTLPTKPSGWHDNAIKLLGAGKHTTRLLRGANVILIDASGTISVGVSRPRVHFQLADMELDGGGTAGWNNPLLRQYYILGHYVENVRFVDSAGPAIRIVEAWDSGWHNVWIENCGNSNIQSILAAWNGGTSILGTEPLQILCSEADPQPDSSAMGYSLDNSNNLYFTNLNISVDNCGHIYTSRNAGGGSPHNCFFKNVKLESISALQPFVRCYGLIRSTFQDVSMSANGLGSGVGAIDGFHLSECTDFKINGAQLHGETAYTFADMVHLFASNDRITLRDLNASMISGGSGTAATGRVQGMYTTASGNTGPRGMIWAENAPTNVVMEGNNSQTGSFTTRLSGAMGAGFRDASSLGPPPLFLKAGAVVDGDFPVAQNGQMAYDSTNNQIYVRSGGTWRKTAALT